MTRKSNLRMRCAAALLLAAIPSAGLHSQRKLDNYNLGLARGILQDAYDNLKKHYYDTKFHGLDIDSRFHEFDQKVSDASSLNSAFVSIAEFLDGLNDPQTFFEPPSRPYRVDSDYRIQMYGHDCFVSRVRPGTEAESMLHPGDQVLLYNEFAVDRDSLWRIERRFNRLLLRPTSTLEIRDLTGQSQQITIDAKVREWKEALSVTGGLREGTAGT
jgi:hypothetical protein